MLNPTMLYINNKTYELLPGDQMECPVIWSFPFFDLVLTLRITLVEDKIVRLDTERTLRRQRSWKILRAARSGA